MSANPFDEIREVGHREGYRLGARVAAAWAVIVFALIYWALSAYSSRVHASATATIRAADALALKQCRGYVERLGDDTYDNIRDNFITLDKSQGRADEAAFLGRFK